MRKTLPFFVIGWTLIATLARAIRLPNDFAEAYWLLDYRFGFIKRGFVGALCNFVTSLLGLKMNPYLIAILSSIVFLGMLIAFMLILSRLSRLPNSFWSLGLVFASSPFIVINAYFFGYFDALMFVLTIAAVALILRGKPFWAAFVSAIAILSHESYFLVGFPLVFLAAFSKLTIEKKNYTRLAISLLLTVLVFASINVLQTLTTDSETLRQQLTQHLDSFGFVQTRSRGVALWETTPVTEFFEKQSGDFYLRLVRKDVFPIVIPPLAFFLVFILSLWNHVPRAVLFFAFGAIFAPLILHAVAWDTARISNYAIGCAFVAIWILMETYKPPDASPLFIPLALVVLLMNIQSRALLMDGETERFSDAMRLLIYSPAIIQLLFLTLRSFHAKKYEVSHAED